MAFILLAQRLRQLIQRPGNPLEIVVSAQAACVDIVARLEALDMVLNRHLRTHKTVRQPDRAPQTRASNVNSRPSRSPGYVVAVRL